MQPSLPKQEEVDSQLLEQDNQTQQKKHKRPQRKKKHKVRRHSPEHYEQIKQLKLNKKRQLLWDDRFSLGSIPSSVGFARNMTSSKRNGLRDGKKPQTIKEAFDYYKQRPSREANKQKPSKSFNVRVVSRKQEAHLTKKEAPTSQLTQQHNGNANEELEALKKQVVKAQEQIGFLACHRDLMISLIQNSRSQQIRDFVNREMQKIKSGTSSCSAAEKAIRERQQLVSKLQAAENRDVQSVTKYQIATLRVIENILKWKEEWQKHFQAYTKVKPTLCFLYNNTNHLLEIFGTPVVRQQGIQAKGNPFLLGLHAGKVEKELIIKIRACEMLLLEEQLKNK